MEFHPVVHTFPPLGQEELSRLEASILARHESVQVTLWEGKCIDGFHRVGICEKHGIGFGHATFIGSEEEAIAHAWALNDARRQMSSDDRAMAGAKIAAMLKQKAQERQEKGGLASNEAKGRSAEKAAEMTGSSRAQVNRAATVLANGTPQLQAAVNAGTVSVSDAAKIAGEPAKVQNAAVQAVKAGEAKTVAAAVATPKLLCRPCRTRGAKPGCKECARLNAGKREPGDDTDVIEEDNKAAKKAIDSKPHFDWALFRHEWTALLFQLDMLCKIYKCKTHKKVEVLRKHIGLWRDDFYGLYEEVSGLKVPKS